MWIDFYRNHLLYKFLKLFNRWYPARILNSYERLLYKYVKYWYKNQQKYIIFVKDK